MSMTPLNLFDRDKYGRPCATDDLLERMKAITSEQARAILDREKYYFQFDDDCCDTRSRTRWTAYAANPKYPHNAHALTTP